MMLHLCLLLAVAAANNTSTLNAPRAATQRAEVDQDFAYQGEYVAVGRRGRSWTWTHGLQVVALGDGKFEGYLLDGGLPGAGGAPTSRRKVNGHRQGDTLLLNNQTLRVTITPGAATLADADGSWQIPLEKVERSSPRLNAAPPYGAVRLFDGADTGELNGLRMTADGLLEVGAETKRSVSDFQMHLEFRLPYMPHARSQGRGNSGVYMQRRYEVQILDSFGLEGKADECGGIYRQQAPDLNMCLPPLTWQTYDIVFRAARWDSEGHKIANARVTVYLNGVAIHHDREILTKTGAGLPEGPDPKPILLQNHNDPVQFRNIWLVELAPEVATTCACRPLREWLRHPLRRR